MKKRIILGKGFIQIFDNRVKLYGKQFTEIKLRIPGDKIWCFCKKGCACKPWTLVIEQ